MSIKDNALHFVIKEQVIEHPASGLKFHFSHAPGSEKPYRMKVSGSMPSSSVDLEFMFDNEGRISS